jgi:hypothetical protein
MTPNQIADQILIWTGTASEDEKRLARTIEKFENKYFNDVQFEPESITGDFFAVEFQDDSGKLQKDYEDVPFPISLIQTYVFKLEEIKAEGQCDTEKHIICIKPKYKTKKAIILHEMIHAYEGILLENPLGEVLRDMLFISLYKDLNTKIKNLDNLIMTHGHSMNQRDITTKGGFHGILFYLKSLDLDLRLGLKLGTVCGYGRDKYNTGEQE